MHRKLYINSVTTRHPTPLNTISKTPLRHGFGFVAPEKPALVFFKAG
jgi:hypothetical protein